MKCANHPEVDSVAFCGQCGRAVCNDCRRDVRGMVYCENCIASRLQMPGFHGPATGPSPGVALALGFIPGVGAIYNGQIVKALIQVLIFGSLIALADRVGGAFEPLFGLGAAAFYFYMVIDSYQTARAISSGVPQQEWLGLGDIRMGAPVGAALLIGLGVLFLLDNLGVPVFRHVGKFWPVLLIVVGVVLLQKRMGITSAPPAPSPPGSRTSPGPPSAEGPSNIPGPKGM
jgi:TM2 domain-containing membrane protein YozV